MGVLIVFTKIIFVRDFFAADLLSGETEKGFAVIANQNPDRKQTATKTKDEIEGGTKEIQTKMILVKTIKTPKLSGIRANYPPFIVSVLAFMVYRLFELFRYLGCPSYFVRSITKKNRVYSSDKDKIF